MLLRDWAASKCFKFNLQGKVRIISGRWRRRIIRFDACTDVRPTTDAARETLFNWLGADLGGKRCLDLYAGSGALGFEALSRGARRAVFVDRDIRCVRGLAKTAAELCADEAAIVHSTAARYLAASEEEFDIVFIDPPFYRNHVPGILKQLAASRCFRRDATVYVELEHCGQDTQFDSNWTVARSRSAGALQHFLLRSSVDS